MGWKCPRCGGNDKRTTSEFWGGLFGVVVNTLSKPKSALIGVKSRAFYTCSNCGRSFSRCPFCNKDNLVSSTQVFSQIECEDCQKKFIVS